MITIELPPEAEKILREIAAQKGESAAVAVQHLVLEYIEELEDIRDAEKALANPGKIYSSAEVKSELGL